MIGCGGGELVGSLVPEVGVLRERARDHVGEQGGFTRVGEGDGWWCGVQVGEELGGVAGFGIRDGAAEHLVED
ncbi:MAG: hypothetical protein ACLP22_20725, partial [Solirubrobacteraceae bacterium]